MPVHMQAAESSIELTTDDIQSGPRAWFKKRVRTFTRSKWTLLGLIVAGFTTILAAVLLHCACTSGPVPATAGPPTTGVEEADFGRRFLEDISGHVVGGGEAQPNAWPSQVSVQYLWDGKYHHMCGAVLLHKRYAITAAHCVDWSKPETLRAVVGEHDLDVESGREQMLNISGVHIHPWWDGDVYRGYDLAVVEFASNVTVNQFVQPAAVPPRGQILPHNYTCYTTGWGRTKAGNCKPHVLMQAVRPVVDHETCSREDWWGGRVKTNMICAGGNGVDSGCHGDGGGPLMCEENGTWVVHGVVSWGHGRCNVLKKPTVFTRLSEYIGPSPPGFKFVLN